MNYFQYLLPNNNDASWPTGARRKVTAGETLVDLNQQPTKLFVVVIGKLELSRVNDQKEEVFAVCGPGMFTGEMDVLSGRRGLARIRAAEPSELILGSGNKAELPQGRY